MYCSLLYQIYTLISLNEYWTTNGPSTIQRDHSPVQNTRETIAPQKNAQHCFSVHLALSKLEVEPRYQLPSGGHAVRHGGRRWRRPLPLERDPHSLGQAVWLPRVSVGRLHTPTLLPLALVAPVSRVAILRLMVHGRGSYLEFEVRVAFSAVGGRGGRGDGHLVGAVEALVAVCLGVLHVVLAATRDRRVHLLRHRHGLIQDNSVKIRTKDKRVR